MRNRFLFILICFISCNPIRHINSKICNVSNETYDFKCCTDYLQFSFHNPIVYKADYDTIYPIPFIIKLPLGLKAFGYVGSHDFIFYYKNKQSVYIRVDILKKTNLKDSVFTTTIYERDSIVEWPNINLGEISERKIQLSKNRKNLVIHKDNTTILLFNIKRKNFDKFYKNAMSFEISK